MSKQAMGDLVDQCEAWGLVTRERDARDARARRIASPPPDWTGCRLPGRREQAEAEFRVAVGAEVATVVALGLEAYASGP
jgi:hypothetical protein